MTLVENSTLWIRRPRMWERMLVRVSLCPGDRVRLCAPSVTQPDGNVMFDGTIALFHACIDRGMFLIEKITDLQGEPS